MITDSNQVYFAKMTGRRIQEGVFRKEEDTFCGQVLDY
jgi:hypothetical protein